MINRLKSPVRVDLVLNKDCNHKCLHCYNPWREGQSHNDVYKDEDMFKKIDKVIYELNQSEVWSAILTGGEPLMHPEVLYYCIKKLNESGISMSLNTNLSLINQNIIDCLKNACCWSNIILTSLPSLNEITCDAITQISGSYKRIIEGIDLCVENGLKVGINTVISKKNIDDLPRYVDFVREHSVDYVSVSIVIPPVYDSRNSEYYLNDDDIINISDTLIKIRKECNIEVGSVTPLPLCILKDVNKYLPIIETTCLAGISKCSIDVSSGDIFACAHESKGYGNIYKQTLKEAWNNMNYWNTKSILRDECRECKWIYICGAECRMMKNEGRKKTSYTLNKNADIAFDTSLININVPLEDEILCINDSFKYRKEEFGYLIRTGFTETMVKEPVFKLCKVLKEMKCFTLNDIKKIVDNYKESELVVRTLIKREIILRFKYER